MAIRIETKLTNKTLLPGQLRKAIAKKFDAYAKNYYKSQEGSWLHKVKNVQFNDQLKLVNWLLGNKPKNEDNSLNYLALALSFGNKSVKNMLKSFRWTAPAHDYYTSNEGAWLHKAKDFQFNDPLKLVKWLFGNKPSNEDNCLSYLVQALSFGNKKVRENLRNWQTYAGAYAYYTSNKGSWLHLAKDTQFNDPLKLIKWLLDNKPINEDNSLGYLILALSIGNNKVREKLEFFKRSADAHDYLISDKGFWLRKAENIDFNNPIHLINWIIRNKPPKENNSLENLVFALSFGNKKVRENFRNWQTDAAAYTYILKKVSARGNLNQTYSKLISNRIRREAITSRMLKKSINKRLFMYLRDEKKEISRQYLDRIVKVFLDCAEHFLTVK